MDAAHTPRLDFESLRFRCSRCEVDQAVQVASGERSTGDLDGTSFRFTCASPACESAGEVTIMEVPDAAGTSVGPGRVDLRNFSVRCTGCDGYPTLAHYRREVDSEGQGWNVYTYQCEDDVCQPPRSRDLLLHPDVDVFANRDPNWHGGKVHAGADAGGHGDAG